MGRFELSCGCGRAGRCAGEDLAGQQFCQELAQENMEQLLDMLKQFIADIKAALKGTDPVENAPYVDIRENIGGSMQYLEEIRQMYDKLAAGAVQNYQAAMEAETQKNTTQEGSVSHSIKRTRRMTLQQQLSAYYSKDFMRSDSFYFGDTSANLTRSGLESHPLAMMQDDFKKSTRTKHNIPRRVLKKLHSAISHPVFSFTAGKQVAIMTTEIDGDGKPVVVAIHGGHNMDRKPVNVIKSIYGVDSVAQWIGQQIDGGSKFRVYDIEKTTAMLQTEGYLAEVGAESDGSWDTITQTNVGVKGENARVSRKSRMTDADIQAVQSIGRISVNQFSSADIKATERFAEQYWKEMGVKSPFFRAWFGDWRANDQTKVQVATQKGDTRGVQKNADTGWDIQVSGKVFNETKVHTEPYNKAARPYLPYINDIVKKAVLLDSSGIDVGRAKSNNSLLMHSLYAVADIGNGLEIIKLYVEEMNNPNAENTSKRAYQLQNIEKYHFATKSSQNTASSRSVASGTVNTVADLFAAVKQKDSSFQPNPASKVVNRNGTPLEVYHGTTAQFWAFNGGAYFTDDYMNADGYASGERIVEAYLSMKNPLIIDCKGAKWDDLDAEYGSSTQEIVGKADNGKFDGVIFENINDSWIDDAEYGDISTVYYPFKNTQIKSATDNIGTFDGTNADIRYKRRASVQADQTGAVVNEILAAQGKEAKVSHHARHSIKNPEKLDPRTVTEADVLKMLNDVRDGKYYDNTYIPVRINTPSALIYWAKERLGDVIDNNPIAISAGKAYQAMARSGEDIDGTPHELSPEDIVEIIRTMNKPRYIIFQGENERYAEVIQYETSTKKKAVAVLDIGFHKAEWTMNGFEAGLYNILVTTFPPDTGVVESMLSKKGNVVIFDSEKDASRSAPGSNVPSDSSDTPFYEDSIIQEKEVVKSEEKDMASISGKKRGTTLSDREVLEVAALRMDTSTLTEGEQTALQIFKDRLAEMRKLQVGGSRRRSSPYITNKTPPWEGGVLFVGGGEGNQFASALSAD